MSEDFEFGDIFPEDDALVPELDGAGDHAKTIAMSLDGYTFDTLVGFDDEIARLRELGVLDGVDESYLAFVEQMKAQHGLYDEPSGNTVVFQSATREDADRLMIAAANELGHPIMRMKMLEGPMGAQMLCIMASQGLSKGRFDGPGTLILEGVDTWGSTDPATAMGMAEGLPLDERSQGAVKAVNLIRDAVANPEVSVFASLSFQPEPHSPLSQLLGPATLFEIPEPNGDERAAIWDHLMHKHVSMSANDAFELVRLSRGMPRCDIFAAAREAVSQAYHESLDKRTYIPVTRSNLFEKIAAYQPLDSDEYRTIEDSMVEDFLSEIDRYEHGEM